MIHSGVVSKDKPIEFATEPYDPEKVRIHNTKTMFINSAHPQVLLGVGGGGYVATSTHSQVFGGGGGGVYRVTFTHHQSLGLRDFTSFGYRIKNKGIGNALEPFSVPVRKRIVQIQ